MDHGPELVVRGAPLARPAEPPIAVRYHAALLADHCVDRDVAAPPATDVVYAVLDRSYALAAGYAPTDLVPASTAGLTGSSGTKLVRSVVLEDLAAMGAAWREAGLAVIVESAYRSYAAQAATFDGWVVRLGYPGALVRSARAGHSEHQLGTAIDVSSPGWTGRFGDWAVESPEGAWMADNAWRFGFVMSYPAGSEARTCFSYEPWHYRWIGRDAAAAHRSSGLHLRQFLERYVGG
jgi:D-alanyl-D-alanine carboxypeptidase